ncbi:MAG: alpha/beta fold hydrolase [Nitratireductor sp.]
MSSGISYKSRGVGPALVFLHGVGGGAESWDAQLAFFGDRFRALAWDMPGYGGSAPATPADFPQWAEALAAWLDEIDVDRCVLVGHSIGGMIAQQFMTRHAHRVTRLVLSATSPAFGRLDGDFQRDFIRSRIGPLDDGKTMSDLAAQFIPGLVGADADPDGIRNAVSTMSRVAPQTYRDAMQALVRFDLRDRLASIGVPTLLVAGEHDKAAPAKVMERMAEKIPDARYACAAGAGHLANMERPEVFNAILAEFLEA